MPPADLTRTTPRHPAPRIRLNPNSGLFSEAQFIPSPNCDERPPDLPVDLVVVHGISLPPGEFGGPWIEALFTNTLDCAADPRFAELAALTVSAHVLIRRDARMLQFVPTHRRAWHAGRSSFEGRPCCNDYSLGIELEGADTIPYTLLQYRMLARLLDASMQVYPAITPARIVAHSTIAPGRKTDPGPAFNWNLLHRLLQSKTPRDIPL